MKLTVKSHRPTHELPTKQIREFQHEHPLGPLGPCEWYGTQRDPTVRHESRDPEYLAEARMDATPAEDRPDMALADYECPHGKLPIDNNITCGCWGSSIEQLPLDLQERIRAAGLTEAVAALIAA